jgi:AP-1-like factor
MEPLTPNTSAFLSYLSSNVDQDSTFTNNLGYDKQQSNPTSLPPSAFFNLPLPGRDTPEDTPPSSVEGPSQSPEKGLDEGYDGLSPDSEEDTAHRTGLKGWEQDEANHKRKVGHGHMRHHEEDEDEDGM